MADEPAAAQPDLFQTTLHFDGPDYVPEHDLARLSGQNQRIYGILLIAYRLGLWLTLGEIQDWTRTEDRPKGDPEASISAQLRHLRKPRFGSHTIEKRRRGGPGSGLWEYRMGNHA